MDKAPLEAGETSWTPRPENSERPGSWAFQLALCLLGPLFFLSYLFTLLSPLPLLYLHVGTPVARRGRFWAGIALAIGTFLAASIHGWLWGALPFFLFAALPALVLGEMLLRQFGPERAVLSAMLAVACLTGASAWITTRAKGQELMPIVRARAEAFVRESTEHLLKQDRKDVPEATQEELKAFRDNPEEFLKELPGIAASVLFLLCALPCIALIRWNPKGFLRRMGIPRDFLRRWKTPDWMIWPALLSGAFLLYEAPIASDIARNAIKPIVLIYFFHGMSILAFFLDSLRLRGPFRVFFYGLAILFFWPMVVGFGFFDLWFNFRGRNRLVNEE